MKGIIPLVLLGGAAYLLLRGQTAAAAAAPVTTAPSAPTPPPPTGPSAASVLAKLQAAAPGAGLYQSGGNWMGTIWQWNSVLATASGINLATVAGDFGKVFPGIDATATPLSLDQFWAGAAPFLRSQGSLSGIAKSFPNRLAGMRVRTPARVLAGWR